VKVLSFEQQQYRDSYELTKLQWEIGPLAGQFQCSRNADTASGPMSGTLRCKSNACKPGDLFGCATINARDRSNRIAFVLDGWLDSGHAADLALFEVTGRSGESLRAVLETAQKAMLVLFSGGQWQSQRRRMGIAGQISCLEVANSGRGHWIIRRWLILGSEVDLSDAQRVSLSKSLTATWEKSLDKALGSVERRSVSLRPLGRSEVRYMAEYITGSVSLIDHMLVAGEDEASGAFGVRLEGEQSIAALWKLYLEESEWLRSMFRHHHAVIGLVPGAEGGVEVWSRELVPGRRTRTQRVLTPVSLPVSARGFAEFAVETKDIRFFTPRGRHPEWSALISSAGELPVAYAAIPEMPGDGNSSRRLVKK
jgi:hypothetical protein